MYKLTFKRIKDGSAAEYVLPLDLFDWLQLFPIDGVILVSMVLVDDLNS